ncbi:hypothetical protein [Paenimyroides aestuarii]|uniref:Uncharacterized protein n=1 Tax=Paenimyroides aestuarii TaxID=2968490 RepID=A0ABY5NVV5_9FLAO|nr:hypothetical protein [Paenimyroides aestuarii]UUV22726.1 hypothetical protein NPX36_06710 [Paenimyroides aestuarii]
MDFFLIFSGQIILYIFLFNRKILVDKKYQFIFLFACIVLFALGDILQNTNVKGGEALKIPLLQWGIYRIFYFIFVKLYKREPKDTFGSMDKTLMIDGVFNALFWFIAFILPLALVFTNKI